MASKSPRVQAISSIGAGDSAIAGFLAATVEGKDSAGRLASAVAFGTAACLMEGTQPPTEEMIQTLLPQIQIL